jgi:hypothetical protein
MRMRDYRTKQRRSNDALAERSTWRAPAVRREAKEGWR